MKNDLRGFLLVDALVLLAIVALLVSTSALSLSALTASGAGLRVKQSAVSQATSAMEVVLRNSFYGTESSIIGVTAAALGITIANTPDPESFILSFSLGHVFRTDYIIESRITNPHAPLLACDPFVSADWRTVNTEPLQLSDTFDIAKPSASVQQGSMLAATFSEARTATSSTLLLSTMGRSGLIHGEVTAQFDNAITSRVGYSALVWPSDSILVAANRFGSASHVLCGSTISCAQLHVYSAQPPALIGSLSLSTTTQPLATRSGGATAGATSLAATGTLLALGLERTDRGMEFNLIDAQNPQNLQWLGGVRIGRSINAIAVLGSRAYVGTDDPTRELVVIDIADPKLPIIVATWDAPGSQNFGIPVSVHAFGNTVIVGRSYVGNAPELYVLSADTLSPIATAEIGTASSVDGIRALLIQDFLVTVLTQRSIQTFSLHNSTLRQINKTYLQSGTEGVSLSCIGNSFLAGVWAAATTRGSLLMIQGL